MWPIYRHHFPSRYETYIRTLQHFDTSTVCIILLLQGKEVALRLRHRETDVQVVKLDWRDGTCNLEPDVVLAAGLLLYTSPNSQCGLPLVFYALVRLHSLYVERSIFSYRWYRYYYYILHQLVCVVCH